MSTPTIADIEAVAALEDPVLRNLRITQCYHELSHAMAAVTGACANWCTFATWASRQAGVTIRGEDARRAAEDLVGSPEILEVLVAVAERLRALGVARDLGALRAVLVEHLRPEQALRRAGEAVARGNLKVFAEIGREFSGFVEMIGDDEAVYAGKWGAFSSKLRRGEPPEGQDLLLEAFAIYGTVRIEPAGPAKMQSLYYANLLVGLHEQTRLQPEILEAMNASLGDAEDIRGRICRALLPGWWLRVRHYIGRLFGREMPLDRLLDRLIACAQRAMRQTISEMLMTLRLPGEEVVRVARDLTPVFPASLAQLSDERLLSLLARLDPTPNSPAGSGARDWADLANRMHFIADFFRCYHERAELFGPPFSEDQVSVLHEDGMPRGPF